MSKLILRWINIPDYTRYIDQVIALDEDVPVEAGGEVLQAEIRGNIAAKLNKNSKGQLSADVTLKSVQKGILEVGVQPTARSSKYALAHEFGVVITPKRARALRFEIDGEVIYTQKVTLPARPYVRPAFDNSLNIIVSVMQRSFNKLIK